MGRMTTVGGTSPWRATPPASMMRRGASRARISSDRRHGGRCGTDKRNPDKLARRRDGDTSVWERPDGQKRPRSAGVPPFLQDAGGARRSGYLFPPYPKFREPRQERLVRHVEPERGDAMGCRQRQRSCRRLVCAAHARSDPVIGVPGRRGAADAEQLLGSLPWVLTRCLDLSGAQSGKLILTRRRAACPRRARGG